VQLVRLCWTRTRSISWELTEDSGGRQFQLPATKLWLLQGESLCADFLAQELLGFGDFAVPLGHKPT
jgi:hypothetical protein